MGFFRMNQQTSPTIEDKLSKQDCTLEDLLIEEDIMQEIKNQNSKIFQL